MPPTRKVRSAATVNGRNPHVNSGLNANVRVVPAVMIVLPNCDRRSGCGNVTLGPPTCVPSGSRIVTCVTVDVATAVTTRSRGSATAVAAGQMKIDGPANVLKRGAIDAFAKDTVEGATAIPTGPGPAPSPQPITDITLIVTMHAKRRVFMDPPALHSLAVANSTARFFARVARLVALPRDARMITAP